MLFGIDEDIYTIAALRGKHIWRITIEERIGEYMMSDDATHLSSVSATIPLREQIKPIIMRIILYRFANGQQTAAEIFDLRVLQRP